MAANFLRSPSRHRRVRRPGQTELVMPGHLLKRFLRDGDAVGAISSGTATYEHLELGLTVRRPGQEGGGGPAGERASFHLRWVRYRGLFGLVGV